MSIFAINTWFLPYENFWPNGASWTISTLFFWYWLFPYMLPRLQRYTDKEIASKIVKYFWVQIGLAFCVIIAHVGLVGSKVICTSKCRNEFSWVI